MFFEITWLLIREYNVLIVIFFFSFEAAIGPGIFIVCNLFKWR